jgi:hypothetical protein
MVHLAWVLTLAVTAAGLSMQVQPGSEQCYFLDVERATKHKIITSFEVISGDFTLDLHVTGPPNDKTYKMVKEKVQERFLFEPEVAGLYKLCFSNFASAGTVGFSVHPEDEEYPDVALKGKPIYPPLHQFITGISPLEHITPLEDAMVALSDDLQALQQQQRYMRARERVHRESESYFYC